MSSNNDFKCNFKIILIGDSETGKTSYVKKLIENTFSYSYEATIISKFYFKTYEKDGNAYGIQIYDLGDSKFGFNSIKIFAKDSHGCIIFSDCMEGKTRDNTIIWKNKLDEIASFFSFFDGGKIPCILVETKSDLLDGNENDISNEIEDFAQKNGFQGQFLTSSKEGKNINESIEYLINNIITRMEKLEEKGKDVFSNERKSIILDPERIKYHNNIARKIKQKRKKLEQKEKKEKPKHFCVTKDIKFKEEEGNNLEFFLIYDEDGKMENYTCHVNLDNLKKKYKIMRSITNIKRFINILNDLKSKGNILIKYYLPEKVIQIGILFFTLDGHYSEVTFELICQSIDEKTISKELIKELINRKNIKSLTN